MPPSSGKPRLSRKYTSRRKSHRSMRRSPKKYNWTNPDRPTRYVLKRPNSPNYDPNGPGYLSQADREHAEEEAARRAMLAEARSYRNMKKEMAAMAAAKSNPSKFGGKRYRRTKRTSCRRRRTLRKH